MGKNEVDTLYQNAIYQHLLGEGYAEYMADVESRRRIMRTNEL